MSLTNPDYGLQLTNDTIVLYKSIVEVGAAPPSDGTLFVDSAGNYDFPAIGTAGTGPHPVSGPLGRDGVLDPNLSSGQFGISFRYHLPSASGRPTDKLLKLGGLTSSTPQAVNDAFRDVGGFTQQVMFYYDPSIAFTTGAQLLGTNNNSSSATSGDYLARLFIDTVNHDFSVQFESANVRTTVNSPTCVATPERWHVVTAVWLPAATGYDVTFHIHELNAGVVTGGQKSTHLDQGTLPLAASGLGVSFRLGTGFASTSTWCGHIAFARIYKGVLNASQAASQASELLLTGELVSEATTNDLFRIEFNERPGFIDEGPLGLHGWLNQGELDTTSGGVNDRHIDLVGTGGRTRSLSHSTVYGHNHVPNTAAPGEMNAQFPGYTKLEHFFNDTVVPIPSYTIQQIGWWGSSPNSEQILQFYAINSTGYYRGPLLRVTLNVSTGSITWLSYNGAGGAASISNSVSAGALSASTLYQTMLLTLRCGENPGSPGVMRFRMSINDNLDAISGDLSNIPGDGRWGVLQHGFPTEGLYQEMKLTFGEIADQDILDDWARIASREGAGGPATVWRMRGYDTTLGRHVYWNASTIDSAGASYGGPGPLTHIGAVRRIS